MTDRKKTEMDFLAACLTHPEYYNLGGVLADWTHPKLAGIYACIGEMLSRVEAVDVVGVAENMDGNVLPLLVGFVENYDGGIDETNIALHVAKLREAAWLQRVSRN